MIAHGTAYYPDYYPKDQWAPDLDRMASAGIRIVRILEFAWCWYQPTPNGFRWQGLDEFLELCLDRGIEVCLCTPTATPPPWFMQRHPDCRLLDHEGRPCFSHRHFVCWDHPGARAEALETIANLVQRYGKHPAVSYWQIDNEPNYAEQLDTLYDFNPHTLAKARVWLEQRYQTLDALNESWFNGFWSQSADRWDQIWETHKPTVNPQSRLDFHRWRERTVAEFVQAQAALLRQRAPAARIGTNIPEVGPAFSNAIAQDYWAQAQGLDWVGTDLYAASGDRQKDLSALRYSCDLMRSVAREASFILSESQGGPHWRTWKTDRVSEPWEVDYLEQICDVYAERGASQIWHFMWRPTLAGLEMGRNGVQDLDGNDTERTARIRQWARDKEAFREPIARYAARPLALIHYPQDTIRFLAAFDQLPALDANLTGAHRQLDQAGFRIQFVTDEDLDKGRLPDAGLFALPESQLLSDDAVDSLLAWGAAPSRRILLGPNTALLDSRGHLRPPSRQPLQKRLGYGVGMLHDLGEKPSIDGEAIDCFRVLDPGANECLQTLSFRGAPYPAILRSGSFLVHAYPWGKADGFPAAHALPVGS